MEKAARNGLLRNKPRKKRDGLLFLSKILLWNTCLLFFIAYLLLDNSWFYYLKVIPTEKLSNLFNWHTSFENFKLLRVFIIGNRILISLFFFFFIILAHSPLHRMVLAVNRNELWHQDMRRCLHKWMCLQCRKRPQFSTTAH